MIRPGGVKSCTELLWAIEVMTKDEFESGEAASRALREGMLQLIGMNADNHHASPFVILTGFAEKHFVLSLSGARGSAQSTTSLLHSSEVDQMAI